MIIAVSGNICSGKSTLSKLLHNIYGFKIVPFKRREMNFLDDFFNDINKMFLPTQLSFLISKVDEINELQKNNENIVIDRSVYEDIHIFANYWIENYNIDKSISDLYYELAEYLYNSAPKVDLYIYCKCNEKKCKERFNNRERRSFEKKYPDNYIEDIGKRYDQLTFPSNSSFIEINTEVIDFRNSDKGISVVEEILNCYSLNESNLYKQLTIFDYENDEIIQPKYKYISNYLLNNKRLRNNYNLKKRVYIAAPFTSMAKPVTKIDNQLIQDFEEFHGVLPKSYQNILNKISNTILNNYNFDVVLPHRDINKWGNKQLNANEIVPKIFEEVSRCSVLICIPSTSIGCHMELSFALGQGKKVLIFQVENIQNSFYVEGFEKITNVRLIKCKSILDIPEKLILDDIKTFFLGE